MKIWSQRHDKGEVINRIRSTQVLFITSPRRNVSFEPCDILVVRRTQINWITDFNTTTEYFPSSECLLVHSFFIISPFFFFLAFFAFSISVVLFLLQGIPFVQLLSGESNWREQWLSLFWFSKRLMPRFHKSNLSKKSSPMAA